MSVILDDYTIEHLDKTYIWMQDTSLKDSFLLRKDISKQNHKRWYENIVNDSSQIIKAIICDNTHCGNCGLKNIDHVNKKAELWIYIGETNMQGKGIAQNAVLSLLKFSVDNLLLHKIYLHVADFNGKAIHIYRKCGFKEEGFLTDEIFYKKKFVSLYRMGFIHK